MISSYALAAADLAAPPEKTVTFKNAKGEDLGTAVLVDNPHGTLIRLDLHNIPPGIHAIHIHEKGACDATDGFKSAGGHLNPQNHQHGYHSDEGPHAGDMPNLDVGDSGALKLEIFNDMVNFTDKKVEGRGVLLDEDSSALIIHTSADDYITQPTGGAGDRIGCAEVK